jgi:cyclase
MKDQESHYTKFMTFPRLIPIITLIGDGAVKTTEFKNPRYVGDPANTVSLFSSFEAEELVVLDISESFAHVGTSEEVLRQIIENASMPIAFGGGIKTLDHARKCFDLGFDKVILRTSLPNLRLLDEVSNLYGTQALAGCLDYRWSQSRPNEFQINNAMFSFEQIPALLKGLQDAGLGEVIIQNISRDGLRLGLEMSPLLELAIEILDIPVVALGGCSSVQNAADFIRQSKCHSVAAATTFLFRPTREAVLINYPKIDEWHKYFETGQDG